MGLVARTRLWLLLQAALVGLDHCGDGSSLRQRRGLCAAGIAAAASGHQPARLRHRQRTLRTANRRLGGAGVRVWVGRGVLSPHHLDGRPVAAVLGGGAVGLSQTYGQAGLALGNRVRRRARPWHPGQIRHGLFSAWDCWCGLVRPRQPHVVKTSANLDRVRNRRRAGVAQSGLERRQRLHHVQTHRRQHRRRRPGASAARRRRIRRRAILNRWPVRLCDFSLPARTSRQKRRQPRGRTDAGVRHSAIGAGNRAVGVPGRSCELGSTSHRVDDHRGGGLVATTRLEALVRCNPRARPCLASVARHRRRLRGSLVHSGVRQAGGPLSAHARMASLGRADRWRSPKSGTQKRSASKAAPRQQPWFMACATSRCERYRGRSIRHPTAIST